MVKIYIDPGHGGTDPGAVGNGLQEKALTLQIAQRVRELLSNYNNVEVRMSRTGDQTRSLSDRTNDANSWGADYFMSIHINAGGGTGYEDFIYPGVGAPTTTYQNLIHEEIMKLVNFSDRGKKSANFHVLRETAMPAILTENGFIDNVNDANKLRQASFIQSIAQGHVNGLVRAFGLQRKAAASKPSTPSSSLVHTVVKGDTFWSLSQKYGTTVANLKKLNPSVKEDALKIGSKLNITAGANYHKVVRGDTVSGLAKEHGSTIKQIRDWNKLDAKYTIYVGQNLRVK
ncbi:N-acetylmuramoyl-L-alanine amidase [Cytobacillus sp. FSL K6-0129]|uniref:N-acetylmuramoyl-L-alanine amidase n=1 Tax=Cytobacillus sp. FSL K6-0129 TaxID=2921421 RepID=UPI0030F77D05